MYLCAINCLYSSVHVLHASKILEECILIYFALFGLKWVTNVGARDRCLTCKIAPHIWHLYFLSFLKQASTLLILPYFLIDATEYAITSSLSKIKLLV